MNNLMNPNLLWVIPAAVGLAWALREVLGRRLTRGSTWKRARELGKTGAEALIEPKDVIQGTAPAILHDALRRRVRIWIARAARLREHLKALEERAQGLSQEHKSGMERHHRHVKKSRKSREEPPYLSVRWTVALNSMLATGDLFIIALAIQASDASATPGEAYLTSAALAAALFVMGKTAGYALRDHYDRREHSGPRDAAPIVVAAAIAVFSLGLYMLRRGWTEAWIILATAPAIGAAGVALLGASRLQKGAERAYNHATATGRRADTAARKAAKVRGRVEELEMRANLELLAAGLHGESIQVMAGLDGELTSLERVANEIGVTLGDRFNTRQLQASDRIVQVPLPLNWVVEASDNGSTGGAKTTFEVRK